MKPVIIILLLIFICVLLCGCCTGSYTTDREETRTDTVLVSVDKRDLDLQVSPYIQYDTTRGMIWTYPFTFLIDTVLTYKYRDRIIHDTLRVSYNSKGNYYYQSTRSEPDSTFERIVTKTQTRTEYKIIKPPWYEAAFNIAIGFLAGCLIGFVIARLWIKP